MKMIRFLKSMSRTVHEEHHDQLAKHKTDHDQYHEGSTCPSSVSLTVWRKSLVISCNGFTVIDSGGNLVYRVDNYSGRPEEITLMDGSGIPIYTMRRCKVNNNIIYIIYTSLNHFVLYIELYIDS